MPPKQMFLDSLARCQAKPDFIARFYQRFIASSEDVARRFQFTDFDKQQKMLLRSLELSAAATAGDPEGLQELHARAETHGAGRLAIPPEMYDLWLAAVIATARECDDAWDTQTENAWRIILGFVIRTMVRHSGSGQTRPEQRRYPRVNLALSGYWRTGTSGEVPCLIGDISPGGCFIHSSGYPGAGAPIEVTLTTTGRAALVLHGKVTSLESGRGFGTAFDPLSPPDQNDLERLLESLGPADRKQDSAKPSQSA